MWMVGIAALRTGLAALPLGQFAAHFDVIPDCNADGHGEIAVSASLGSDGKRAGVVLVFSGKDGSFLREFRSGGESASQVVSLDDETPALACLSLVDKRVSVIDASSGELLQAIRLADVQGFPSGSCRVWIDAEGDGEGKRLVVSWVCRGGLESGQCGAVVSEPIKNGRIRGFGEAHSFGKVGGGYRPVYYHSDGGRGQPIIAALLSPLALEVRDAIRGDRLLSIPVDGRIGRGRVLAFLGDQDGDSHVDAALSLSSRNTEEGVVRLLSLKDGAVLWERGKEQLGIAGGCCIASLPLLNGTDDYQLAVSGYRIWNERLVTLSNAGDVTWSSQYSALHIGFDLRAVDLDSDGQVELIASCYSDTARTVPQVLVFGGTPRRLLFPIRDPHGDG